MVILGTVLAAVLIARARYIRQAVQGRRQAAAVRAADGLLTRWWNGGEPLPAEAQGPVEGTDDLLWRTRIVGNRMASEMDAPVLQLEILDARVAGQREQVLARVEILVPPRLPTTAPADARPATGGQHEP